jgi:hypothetical protein
MRRLAFAAGMTFATTAVMLHRENWWMAVITTVTTIVCIYASITMGKAR